MEWKPRNIKKQFFAEILSYEFFYTLKGERGWYWESFGAINFCGAFESILPEILAKKNRFLGRSKIKRRATSDEDNIRVMIRVSRSNHLSLDLIEKNI